MDLERFVTAQDHDNTYERALTELQEGRKRTHWMWFIFPQAVALGRSERSRFYGIKSADEALAYLAHPVLGPRLRESVEAMLSSGRDIGEILNDVDRDKFAASMAMFAMLADDPRDEVQFAKALLRAVTPV